MGVELFELTWVRSIAAFFDRLGWALFGTSVVVCGFEFGAEYVSGRGNLKQTALNELKGFMAVSLFTVVPVRNSSGKFPLHQAISLPDGFS